MKGGVSTWTDGWKDGWIVGKKERGKDGLSGWVIRQIGSCMDGWLEFHELQHFIILCPILRPLCENPAGTWTQACENKEDILLKGHN